MFRLRLQSALAAFVCVLLSALPFASSSYELFSVSAVPAGTPWQMSASEARYINQPLAASTRSGVAPGPLQFTNPNYTPRLNPTQLLIQILFAGTTRPVMFDAPTVSGRPGFIVALLPLPGQQQSQEVFSSVQLSSASGVTVAASSTGIPSFGPQNIQLVEGNKIYVNLAGYQLQAGFRIIINYETVPNSAPQVSSSSTAPQLPEPIVSSTGVQQPEDISSTRDTPIPILSSTAAESLPPVAVPSSSTGGQEQAASSTGLAVPPSTGGNVGGANGDPQISGFMGQSFQVHGTANTDYSVISSQSLQYNAHFVFLSEGKCRAGTECFAHPGNYFGAVGMLIRQEDGSIAKVEVTSGPVAEGMKVAIDGEPLTPSDKHLTIDSVNSLHFASPFELLLQTRDYTLRLQNSDMFLNQQVSIREPLLQQIKAFKAGDSSLLASLPHGILGQTWRRMSYPNRWVHLEGDLMNYIVSGGVLAVPSEFNRFVKE